MLVDIVYAGTIIGRCDLNKLDPPMGVALGEFIPGDSYDPKRHASIVDGEGNQEYDSDKCSVHLLDGSLVDCQFILIHDYMDSLGEREAHVIGIKGVDFEAYFRDHPQYKLYWGCP
ncbi:hypothetical protein [Ancylobacter rudongensis]|uniref:hypothetical protein n=1 Tax=Ancylobacter rudongensis TaxID=177413 RepID=UPI00115FD452|nr:hypothetical protein [Ancylobacter rudongensis]